MTETNKEIIINFSETKNIFPKPLTAITEESNEVDQIVVYNKNCCKIDYAEQTKCNHRTRF